MKILLTGATGFLGQNFKAAWSNVHRVVGLGRDAKNDIVVDLAKEIPVLPEFDCVVHAAGKAHSIPKTESEKHAFYDVNEQGTKNILVALNGKLPQRFVLISTVAVYGAENGQGIAEDSPLAGETPYARSKIAAEKLVEEWAQQNGIDYLILRLPLISGHNPPGNLGAMATAIERGLYASIGNAEAKRSMVGAADVAQLIVRKNWVSGIYNLTDGEHPSIAQTEKRIAEIKGKKIKKVPVWLIRLAAKIGDIIPKFPLNSLRLAKLQSTLTFSDEKAQKQLNWNPKPALQQLVLKRSS